MNITKFKFYNQLDNMIQTPDANVTDLMCNHYRKPVIDPFHTELFKRASQDTLVENSVGVMLTASHYPFSQTSSTQELRDLDGFKKHEGLKIEVSEYMTEIDLQLFSTIPNDILFYDKACKLLGHEMIPKQSQSQFDQTYIDWRNNKAACFINSHKHREPNPHPLMIPTNYFEYLDAADTLQKNQDILDEKNIFFVPFMPAADPEFLITQDMLENAPKPFDCFLSGTDVPFVYPYRFIAFRKILALEDSIKILREGRYLFRPLADKELARFKDGEISKKELDENVKVVARLQYQDYMQRIYDSKVAIVCSSVFGFPVRKYFEYMARGCVLVGDMPKYANFYGLKHMENVFQCEVDEIQDAVKYLLENESLRMRLAKNALNLMHERFTVEKRVDSFLGQLNDIADKHLQIKI